MSKDKNEVDIRHEKATPSHAPAANWPPLVSLREEIDRLFDDFGAGFWRSPLPHRMQDLLSAPARWPVSPTMEIADIEGEYRITAELPGMTPDGIEIKLTDGMITIRGEKTEENKEEKENYLLSERRYGAFHRSQTLPAGIDTDAVTANYSNGVLTVTLPKTAEARQSERSIEVKAA